MSAIHSISSEAAINSKHYVVILLIEYLLYHYIKQQTKTLNNENDVGTRYRKYDDSKGVIIKDLAKSKKLAIVKMYEDELRLHPMIISMM